MSKKILQSDNRAAAAIVGFLAIAAALAATGCASSQVAEAPAYFTTPQGQRMREVAMASARANHAAVGLPGGKVLICGGTLNANVGGVLSSAEIYDPFADSFSPTGSMTHARMGQTATLMDDGRVLIVGGADNIGFRSELASAEIFDPSSGTFTRTASMSEPREGHTATLMRDGRVLVAGGSDNGTHTLDTAEIYDPIRATWTTTGRMTVPREAHVAVRLLSGKILIAGGGRGDMPGGYIAYQNAEIYDPATGQFSKVKSPMKFDRVGAAAGLLDDGRALIVGGKSGKVMTGFYGHNIASFTPLETAELFDPESMSFIATGSMYEPHYIATLTHLPDGNMLVAGGWRVQGPVISGMNDAEVYEAETGRFHRVGPTRVARLENTATLIAGGVVMIAGGIDAAGLVTNAVEFYSTSSHRFFLRGTDASAPNAGQQSRNP